MATSDWWELEQRALQRAAQLVGEAERERLVRRARGEGAGSGAPARGVPGEWLGRPRGVTVLRPPCVVLRRILSGPAAEGRPTPDG
jgi:hypothetical protein